MKTHRVARVAEVIREVASETILFGLRDPRVKMVTVTRAEVSGDLQHAKVYVSIMGTEGQQSACMHALQRAAGFVQSKLGERMRSKFVPMISFVHDKGAKNAIEVNRLINEALGREDAPLEDESLVDDSLVDDDLVEDVVADDAPADEHPKEAAP